MNNDQPLGRIDPEKLKEERTKVDFGTDEETGHNLVGRDAGRAPTDDDALVHPTSGVTPPAR